VARGSKANSASRQKRQARHIEEGYQERGMPHRHAEEIAGATVNQETREAASASHHG
jgi:hypothetical protein